MKRLEMGGEMQHNNGARPVLATPARPSADDAVGGRDDMPDPNLTETAQLAHDERPRLERRIVNLPDGDNRYCVIGPRMAVDFHVSYLVPHDPIAGLECHYKEQPSYLAKQEPFSECCWLTGVRCWGDGTSLYATEWLLPQFRPDDLEPFWRTLEVEHDRRDRAAFGPRESDDAI